MWRFTAIFRDEPDGAVNAAITDSKSFKSKAIIKGKTPAADNTKDDEIAVPLKYLSNFWWTL